MADFHRRAIFFLCFYKVGFMRVLSFPLIALCLFSILYSFEAEAKNSRLVSAQSGLSTDSTTIKSLLNSGIRTLYDDLDSARIYADSAIVLSRQLENRWGQSEGYRIRGKSKAMKGDLPGALSDYDSSLAIATEDGLLKVKVLVLNAYGELYGRADSLELEIHYFKEAFKWSEGLDDPVTQAITNQNLGNAYRFRNQPELSLTYFHKALDGFKEAGSVRGVASATFNIGFLYKHLGRYEEALVNIRQTLSITKDLSKHHPIEYQGIGEVYLLMQQLDSACYYLTIAVEHSKQVNHLETLAVSYTCLGEAYLQMGVYDSAMRYFRASDTLAMQIKSATGQVRSAVGIANAHRKTGDYQSAIDELITLNNRAVALSDITEEREVVKLLSEIYHEKGDYRLAYDYYRKFHALSDSITNDKNNQRLAVLEVQYDTKEKELEIERSNRAEQLAIQKAAHEERVVYFLMIGGAVLILALTGLVVSFRKTRRANTKLQDLNIRLSSSEQELKKSNAVKNKLLSVIAHDLRSPITELQIYTQVFESIPEFDFEKYLQNLNKELNSVESLLNNLLSWALLEQQQISFAPVWHKPYELVRRSLDLVKLQVKNKRLAIHNNIPQAREVFTDPRILDFIIRNLISNAAKYGSEDGELRIEETIGNQSYQLQVINSGKPIADTDLPQLFEFTNQKESFVYESRSAGLGLVLCKEFATAAGAELIVENLPGNYVKFSIVLAGGEMARVYQESESYEMTPDER